MRKGIEVRTEAIVLQVRTWNEDDLLVDFLTPLQGRLRGVARHGRKSQKRFGPVLETMNIVQLRYQDSGGWCDLREASLMPPLMKLDESLERLMAGFYLMDMVREWVFERNPDVKIYSLVKNALVHLNKGEKPSRMIELFENSFLKLQGYEPNLSMCVRCSEVCEPEKKYFFVFKEGGLMCVNCLPPQTEYEIFSPQKVSWILTRFLEYQLGRRLRSHKFLTDSRFSV